MTTWRSAIGRTVVDSTTAATVGAIATMVIDPATSKVRSVVVKGAEPPVIDFGALEAFGPDAVTIKGQDVLRSAEGDEEERAVAGSSDPVGKTALTEDGESLGTVDDLDFDPESGAVTSMAIGGSEVDGQRLLGAGSHAVVVARAEDAEPTAPTPSAEST